RETGSEAGASDGSDSQLPAKSIAPQQAAAYCNWLSEREGIPREQWCYNTLVSKLPPKADLTKPGFRLPTVQENESLGLTIDVNLGMQVESGLWTTLDNPLLDGGAVSEGCFRVVRRVRVETP
ncbi:MAG: hypothetical protein AAFU85_18350, partial [Planctomycetota bacterium]